MNHRSLRKIVYAVLITIISATGTLFALAQDEGNNAENLAESVANACTQSQEPLSAEDIPLSALADLDMSFSELQDFLAEGGNLYDLLPEGANEQTAQARALACIEALAANGDLNAEQAAALRAVIESGANMALREALGNHAAIAGIWGHDHDGGMLGLRGRMPGWRVRPFGMPRGSKPSDELGRSGQFGFRITRDEDGNWHLEEYGDSSGSHGGFGESLEFFGDMQGFALPFMLPDGDEFFDEELLEMLLRDLLGRRGGRFGFQIPMPDDVEVDENGHAEEPSEGGESGSDEGDNRSEETGDNNSA